MEHFLVWLLFGYFRESIHNVQYGSFYYEHFVNVYSHYADSRLRVNLSAKNLIKHLAFLKPDPISVPGLSCVSHLAWYLRAYPWPPFISKPTQLHSRHGYYLLTAITAYQTPSFAFWLSVQQVSTLNSSHLRSGAPKRIHLPWEGHRGKL